MTVNPIFGPIVTGDEVEQAVQATLELWFATYLRELERQTGRDPDSVPAPRSFFTVNEFAQVRGAQMPAVVIVSPGTDEAPRRAGDGSYQQSWAIGVGVIVQAKDRGSANDLAKLYGAAVRAIVIQNASLKSALYPAGFASSIELGAESYDDVPPDFLDVGSVARIAFSVTVPGVVTDLLGPAAPDPDPSPLPTVQTVQIDVQERSLT